MLNKKRDQKRAKNGFTDESLNKKAPLGERLFRLSFLIAIVAILFVSVKFLISYTKDEIQKNENTETNLVVIPDIIGLDVDNAKEILSLLDIKTQIEYSENDFFDLDAVLKMSVDPGAYIEKGSTIVLYLCKKSDIDIVKNPNEYFKDIYVEELPIRKNGIIVKNIFIEKGNIVFVLNNDSEDVVQSLKLTSGYIDATGDKFLNKPSLHLNINIEPYKDFKVKQVLKNPKIKGLTIEKLDVLRKPMVKEEEGVKN